MCKDGVDLGVQGGGPIHGNHLTWCDDGPVGRVTSTEELRLELRRRIIRPRNRRYETWDEWGDGLDAQGSWPEER